MDLFLDHSYELLLFYYYQNTPQPKHLLEDNAYFGLKVPEG